MTCREFAQFIADYLSGELSADARVEFERHLDVCPNCVAYLSNYRDTIAMGRRAFVNDAIVWGIFPHTHVRGTKWEYSLELPDGTRRTILSVPRYNFNWQTYYMFNEPLKVPKGARLVSSASEGAVTR